MILNIELTPAQEIALADAAQVCGVDAAELMKRLTLDHLPVAGKNDEADIDAKLRQWQMQDGRSLLPDTPAQALFAQWDEEDAHMTEEEREAEDQLWADIERGLTENSRALQMRWLG